MLKWVITIPSTISQKFVEIAKHFIMVEVISPTDATAVQNKYQWTHAQTFKKQNDCIYFPIYNLENWDLIPQQYNIPIRLALFFVRMFGIDIARTSSIFFRLLDHASKHSNITCTKLKHHNFVLMFTNGAFGICCLSTVFSMIFGRIGLTSIFEVSSSQWDRQSARPLGPCHGYHTDSVILVHGYQNPRVLGHQWGHHQ